MTKAIPLEEKAQKKKKKLTRLEKGTHSLGAPETKPRRGPQTRNLKKGVS